MNALVTGGAGFIGSNLVDALLDRGDEVTITDDLSTGSRENLVGALERGARLHTVNVTDAEAVAGVLEDARPEVVYHLAAQIDVRRAVSDPARDAWINVVGTATVLQAAHTAGVERVVLASTGGAIYGDADIVPTLESAPPRPLSPYAVSKAAAESYLEYYAREHGLSAFTLRLANVYGPRQSPLGEAGVIARFCAEATLGGSATVYGDGGQTRDFVYVGDAVEAFLAAGERRAPGFCNVSTGVETTVLELAATLGLPVQLAPARVGEVRRSCLAPGAASTLLGWTARTSLAAGLERTLAWAVMGMPRDTAPATGAFAAS